jgi:Uma2 family endonuclease
MTTTNLAPPPAAQPDLVRWADFRELDIAENDFSIYELINGSLVKRAAPSIRHQKAVTALVSKLHLFVREKELGSVFTAPIDVFFDDHNGFQPDICFISKERSFLIDNEDYISGPPDLVVEVLSPGTSKNDRVTKMAVYEQFAVKEYWIVDPLYSTVEIYTMHDNALRLHEIWEAEGIAASPLLEGFSIDIASLFD